METKISRNKLSVVIPTYNEKDNIARLIESISKVIKKTDLIIVVDDNSPDKTGHLVTKLKKKYKNLHVIHRKAKNGRGSAVLEGLRLATKFKADFIIEMDADFSHKPEDIPRLLQKVKKGFDIVIGSRYLPSSKIINWPNQRKIFSKFANLFARIILDVPISDYTNGFRIYSKKAASFLINEDIKSTGYIVLSETAYLLKKASFTFAEIPIVFVNRKRGYSNTNLKEVADAFIGILQIRLSKSQSSFLK